MIRTIIFDAGGTLFKGSFTKFVNKVYKFLGIDKKFNPKDEVTFDLDFNRGLISVDDCFRKLFNVHISGSQMDEIKKYWSTTWVLTDEMRDLLVGLKKNYKLVLLSNSDKYNSAKYYERGWYDYFEVIVLSHEVGILKPDTRIYEMTLEKIGMPAEECLFIDDQKRALEPARKLGMKTILFESVGQLKRELVEMGIKLE